MTRLPPHPPLRSKCRGQLVSRARDLLWNATDTVGARAYVVYMRLRHRSPVAPNAAGVAGT
jgi:hypothetical protein